MFKSLSDMFVAIFVTILFIYYNKMSESKKRKIVSSTTSAKRHQPACDVCHGPQPCFVIKSATLQRFCRKCAEKYCMDHTLAKSEITRSRNDGCIQCGLTRGNFELRPSDATASSLLALRKGQHWCRECLEAHCDAQNPKIDKSRIINVSDKWCVLKDDDGLPCTQRAYYAKEGETTKSICRFHKEEGMKHMSKHAICEHVEKGVKCETRAGWGLAAEGRKRWCGKHKADGLCLGVLAEFDHSKCHYIGCTKRACYGSESDWKPIYCLDHSKSYPDMYDVVNARCEWSGGCRKQPCFGATADMVPHFCVEHAPEGTEEVHNQFYRKCAQTGCKSQAAYGVDSKATHCAKHLPEGHLIYGTCEKCSGHATWGIAGESPTRCYQHRDASKMIHKPTRRCRLCRAPATVGVYVLEYCEAHCPKLPEYKSMISECSICGLLLKLNAVGQCYYCDETQAAIRRHELMIKDHLDFLVENNVIDGFGYDCHNRAVTECPGSRSERPDFVIRGAHINAVLEVDEKQHKKLSYQTCEVPRMINIYGAMAEFDRPMVFIRYNPDSYTVDGKRHDDSITARWQLLDEQLRYYFTAELKSEWHLFVLHLFYDDFNAEKMKLEVIKMATESTTTTTYKDDKHAEGDL